MKPLAYFGLVAVIKNHLCSEFVLSVGEAAIGSPLADLIELKVFAKLGFVFVTIEKGFWRLRAN
jgi:hypothetical protein